MIAWSSTPAQGRTPSAIEGRRGVPALPRDFRDSGPPLLHDPRSAALNLSTSPWHLRPPSLSALCRSSLARIPPSGASAPVRTVRAINAAQVPRPPFSPVERRLARLERPPPEPPHRRPLGVVRLLRGDQERYLERGREVYGGELCGGRLNEREVTAGEGVAEPAVVATLDRHECMFTSTRVKAAQYPKPGVG